jgi:hypothetical protein
MLWLSVEVIDDNHVNLSFPLPKHESQLLFERSKDVRGIRQLGRAT